MKLDAFSGFRRRESSFERVVADSLRSLFLRAPGLSWFRLPFSPVIQVLPQCRQLAELGVEPILGQADQLLLAFERQLAGEDTRAQKDKVGVERVEQAVVVDLGQLSGQEH